VVLDGLERLLLAYSRPDAALLADDDLDEQAANWVADARGLPASAAASFTGQTRLRLTADPRIGAFLKRLATLQKTRVLVTSRLYPRELQTVTTEPVPGVFPYFLRGLTPNDAVQLWRRLGGSGSRAELVELFAAFDNYPLLIRALAGEVARFRRAPGDLSAWRRANPGFNPFRLPLVQRKSHVLEYALRGLTVEDQRILHTVAAFRAPKDYDTLAALLVGDGRPCATEAELDRVLVGLEDRGLLGWDRRGNRYDVHPVVRGVAWAGLDSDAKQGIDLQLAAHFKSIPAIDAKTIDNIDDLAVPTELYHTFLRLGRYKDAFDLLDDRLIGPLFGIRAFRQLAELAEAAASEAHPSWLESIKDEDDRIMFAGRTSTLVGIGYQFAGDPRRASQGYDALMSAFSDLADRGKQQGNRVTRVKALRALTLCQLGRLADAEREAREALAHDDKDDDSLRLKILALGLVLLRRGRRQDGRAWLTDYRTPLGEEGGLFRWMALWEFGWMALSAGDSDSAEWCLARMNKLAEQESRGGPAKVSAMILCGALARREHGNRAGELLTDALLASRSLGLGHAEVVALAELAGWHLDEGRIAQAREHVRDAIELADRAGLRLCWADSLNTLCRIELAAGDHAAAVVAARAAYQQAWCDGPSFSYAQALIDARANLMILAESEPVDLPHHVPTSSGIDISIRPLPPLRNDEWFHNE
jgi:tetratricopeptide (TPR) repeat protein